MENTTKNTPTENTAAQISADSFFEAWQNNGDKTVNDDTFVDLCVPDIEPNDLYSLKIEPEVLIKVPETLARKHCFVPLNIQENKLFIVIADPTDYESVNNIGVYTGMKLTVYRAPKDAIEKKIHDIYTTRRAFDAAKEMTASADKEKDSLESEIDDSQPIIRFVNNMLEQAVLMRASDIHIEPSEKVFRVRFRVNGHLLTYIETDPELAASVVSRIKYIARLNIAEKRIPQDGRTTFHSSAKDVDLRISVLPCAFGEKCVIRITTALSFRLNINNIGFTENNFEKFKKILTLNHGIVLLTGPTGSGKTTTLYAAVSTLNREDINILTVEDPVEMILPGINQVEINPKTGLTFSRALRAILRQDPNVVMVGEIRDRETADIAMSLSITGHLVFSTLHTYDAPSAIIRLVDMGVEPYMVSAALAAVVAQRLVRKICPHCKKAYLASDEEKKLLQEPLNGNITLYKGEGCEKCNHTGYIGRTSVHEIMFMTQAIKEALARGASPNEIKKIAVENGMEPMLDNLKTMVLNGETTLIEMLEAYSADL